MVLRMYERFGAARGWACRVAELSEAEGGGVKSAALELDGPNACVAPRAASYSRQARGPVATPPAGPPVKHAPYGGSSRPAWNVCDATQPPGRRWVKHSLHAARDPPQVRPASGREGAAPARAALAVQRALEADDVARRGRADAALRGRRRARRGARRPRRRRPRDHDDALGRRGRPERQQGRDRRARDARADRDHGQGDQRALAAAQQGGRDCAAQGAAARAPARAARRRGASGETTLRRCRSIDRGRRCHGRSRPRPRSPRRCGGASSSVYRRLVWSVG